MEMNKPLNLFLKILIITFFIVIYDFSYSQINSQTNSQINTQSSLRCASSDGACCNSECKTERSVKFAYLTDTHVSIGTTSVDDLEYSVNDINSLKDVDFVIIGGDITEFGSDLEIAAAKSILDRLKVPYYILSGNHDSKWSESGCNTFAKVFGYEHFDFEFGGIRFIGCNSGPNMRMAPALVPRESIVWLDSLTNVIPRGTPVVFVNHYPLDDEMLNYKEVLTYLARTNIQVALCGHGHNNHTSTYAVPTLPQTSTNIATGTLSSTTSSCSSVLALRTSISGVMGRSNLRAGRPGPGYNIITIGGGKIVFTERMNGETLAPWYTLDILKVPDQPCQASASSIPICVEQPSSPTQSNASALAQSNASVPAQSAAFMQSVTTSKSSANLHAATTMHASDTLHVATTTQSANTAQPNTPITSTAQSKISNAPLSSTAQSKISNTSIISVTPVWTIQDNADIGSGATYAKGVVYFANTAGVVKALDAKNGRLIWQYKTGGKIFSTPAVSQCRLVVGCTDGYIYCFDANGEKIVTKGLSNTSSKDIYRSDANTVSKSQDITGSNASTISESPKTSDSQAVTISESSKNASIVFDRNATSTTFRGKLLWRVKADKSVLASPAIHNGIVYIGASDGIFRAIRLKDGSGLWSYNGMKGFVEAKACVDDEGVYIGDWRNTFYAFQPKTGELLWSWTNKKLNRMLSPAAVWPVKAHGKVFIVTPERVAYALDAATGKEIWNAKGGREAIGLSSDKNAIYIKTMQDSVFAWSTRTDTAERLWSSFSGYGYEIAPSPITTQDGLLFIPTDKGNIFALKESDGQVVWSYNFSIALINYIQPIGHRLLLVSSMDGKVAILKY